MTETGDTGRYVLDTGALWLMLDSLIAHRGLTSLEQVAAEAGMSEHVLRKFSAGTRLSADSLVTLLAWIERGRPDGGTLISRLTAAGPEGGRVLDQEKVLLVLDTIRAHRGLKLAQAAAETGVPAPVLSHFRKDGTGLSADNLIALLAWFERGDRRPDTLLARLSVSRETSRVAA